MKSRRYLGFVAAAATLLAAAPLSAIFDRWTWLMQSIVAVLLVAGAGMLARSLRAPLWAHLIAMVGALVLGLTWMFPSGGELLAVVPTPQTFAHFGELIASSGQDMRSYGVPVPDTDPLLFISVLGVGSVAIVVDLLTVGLRRPALAGLPMLAIYSVPVAVYVDSVPPVPFVVGACGFLWLLVTDNIDRVRHFGRRFTGDGRDVDVWEPSPLAAAGRRLAVVGVVVAVLLPIAIPGMTTGLMDRFNSAVGNGPGGVGQGGGPGQFNMFAALSGELNRTQVREMLKVTTDEEEPYYLRFAVADELKPEGFTVRSPAGRPVTRNLPDPRALSTAGVSFTQHRATVEVTSAFAMSFLPVYASPIATQNLDAGWLYDPNTQVIFSNRALAKGKQYSFDYVRASYGQAVLDAAPSLPLENPIRRAFTVVPEEVAEVSTLVERLTAGKRNDYERVRAIYDYFSRENGFTYSLRTEGGTSGQDIVNFLTNKTGFCQQYASALAWLVRAAGVPARVAFGFTNGSDRQDKTYTLTNLNLHAWTEVYFEGAGWVPFDATPAASVTGSARSQWAPDVDAPDPITSSAAPSTDSSAAPTDGQAGPSGPEQDVDEGLEQDVSAPVQPAAPQWPWWTTAGVLALIVLLAVPALRRNLLRKRRFSRTVAASAGPEASSEAASEAADDTPGIARVLVTGAEANRARADAHAAWDELIDTMIDFRILVDSTETPRATAERLVTHLTAGAPTTAAAAGSSDPSGSVGSEGSVGNATRLSTEATRLLGQAEERARYAREPLRGDHLAEALRTVHGALAATANRRTRLMAAILPPSTLLHWRGTITEISSRLVAMAGRVRSTLLRWSPRRLLATINRSTS